MWREVWELSRPKNVILATITVPIGAHLALSGDWNNQSLILVALQTASAICFMAAGNTLNDVSDVEIDRKTKAHKPIPSGRISIESATKSAYALSFISLAFMSIGSYLTEQPLPVIIIWTIAAFLMYTYDSGFQTKNTGLMGNVAISLMVGAVILFGAASVSMVTTPIVWYAAAVAFFANLAREIVKDCEDMEVDEGRNTLPMRIGIENARAFAYVLVLIAMIVLGLAHIYGPFEYNQIVFHSPAIFILFSLNGPLFRGEDYQAQQKIRVGMFLGLVAFALQVSIL